MMQSEPKRPCVALLGEFSAGKSTLANLLLGRTQSPVRVTATQMPPLWYRLGTGAPVRLLDDESEIALPDDEEIDVPLDGTTAVRVPLDAPVLQQFDLLDMPGSSDPNMPGDVWDKVLPHADAVIWCTPATQAWRQSEAAIWDAMPTGLQQRSMLLLTRFDKVGISDRKKVLHRVRTETSGQFRYVLPAALLLASDPPRACKASGLAKVFEALDDLLENASPRPVEVLTPPTADPEAQPSASPSVAPRRVTSLAGITKTRRRSANNSALI